jgi:hypothetical protein
MANLEITICKSGQVGGCGFEKSNPDDVSAYEERQRILGNTMVARTFCNQQMCSPIEANRVSINKLEETGFKPVTGILVTGVTNGGVEHSKSPGVVLLTLDGEPKTELF